MTKQIQCGDYFLQPYKGSRRSRLVKAIQPVSTYSQHWYVSNEAGHSFMVTLTSCLRCSPSVVKRILETK